jgi:hypothetical protein
MLSTKPVKNNLDAKHGFPIDFICHPAFIELKRNAAPVGRHEFAALFSHSDNCAAVALIGFK